MRKQTHIHAKDSTQEQSIRALKHWFFTSLALPCLFGCQHTFTEVTINAPKETVWEILTDFESYPDWNPYHVRVKGSPILGERLKVEIEKPNGNRLTIHPKVLELERNRILVWGGGITGIFRGEHRFKIIPLMGNSTLVIQEETFSGVAVPFAELDTIEEGYHRVNQALREHAERVETTTFNFKGQSSGLVQRNPHGLAPATASSATRTD